MKDVVTIRELLAIIVRRGKLVLMLGVVFALLMGGMQTYRLSMTDTADQEAAEAQEAYQMELDEYTLKKNELELNLKNTKNKLERQQDYTEKSQMMKLDPYHTYVSIIHLAIANLENAENQLQSDGTGFSQELQLTRIQSQYLAYWEGTNLQTAMQQHPYTSAEDIYLREMIDISCMEGGIITIQAYGSSQQDARKLVESAAACLMDGQTVIAETAGGHTLQTISHATREFVDEEWVDPGDGQKPGFQNLSYIQQSGLAQLKKAKGDYDYWLEQLEMLVEPQPLAALSGGVSARSIVKWTIFGLALGMVLAVIWTWFTYLFRNRIETSEQLQQQLEIPFLGSVSHKKDCWNRWADGILRERNWKNKQQSMEYFSSSIRDVFPTGSTVALLSTVSLEEKDTNIQMVIDCMKKEGVTVSFIGNAAHAPNVLNCMRESDCIVLAERTGISCWNALQDIMSQAKQLEKPVAGFVVI